MPKSTSVIKPNLGLYLDRPSIGIPPDGLQDGLNYRIQLGALNNLNLGWATFNSLQLNGPVRLIEQFNTSEGQIYLIFGSLTDLYQYTGGVLSYITPIYNTGTAAASGTAVTGTTTAWNTTPTGSQWANAKAGDQISFGNNAVVSPTATWFTIQSVNSATGITLTSSAGIITNGNYTIRRLFTGGFANPWETEVFVDANVGGGGYGNGQDLLYLTNGVDNVMNWNGISAQVNLLTSFGFTCRNLVQFSDMMIYLNVVQGVDTLGTTMLNSDIGAPSAVGLASTGVAGQFIVQSGTDPILMAKRLGAYLAIYCNHTIILCTSTGQTTVFSFRIAASNKGPIGQDAIATYPTIHQFIAPDGMYYFDGNNVEPVNTHVWRSVMQSFDHSRNNNIFTYLDEANGEQIWAVPQTTDPGSGTNTSPSAVAWTEHYLEETAGQAQSALIASAMGLNRPYSKRTFAFTAIGSFLNQSAITWAQLVNAWSTYNYRWSDSFFSAAFPIVVVGDNSGNLWQLNASQTGNGTALNSYVTFGRRALIDGRMRGLLRRVYPFVNTFPQPLSVTCAFADFASGPVTTTATMLFDQTFPQGKFMVPIYRRGRYLDLTFGDASGNPWLINGFDVDILPGGMR